MTKVQIKCCLFMSSIACKKATENDEGPGGNRDARSTTTRRSACYLDVKIVTRTINGMYVNNDTAAITRHRKRHILASSMGGVK